MTNNLNNSRNNKLFLIIISIFISFIVTLIFLYLKKYKKVDGIVKEIWIYPIKSTKGIQLTSAKVGPMGFLYDRLFVIVDQKKRFISQRTHSKLALLETSFSKPNLLTVKTPDGESVDIPLEEPPTPYEVHDISIWNDICEGIDMGDDVAKLINTFLGTGQEMRLMRIPDNYERKTDRVYSKDGRTGFADGFPFLILSKASVEQLLKSVKFPFQNNNNQNNDNDSDNNNNSLSALNFRPNIVFDKCPAFAEDTWKEITISSNPKSKSKVKSNITLTIVKPCSRCKMPNVNPNTGEYLPRSNGSGESYYVSDALETFRTGEILKFYPKGEEKNETNKWAKKVFFGQNAEHKGNGVISVGDIVYVQKFQK